MRKVTTASTGTSLVILSSFFYASYGIWTKLMGNFFQGYTASALRSMLVLLLLLPIAFTYHQLQPLLLRKNWPYIIGMLIASLFTWGPLYYAILHAGIGISLAIAYASIVIGSFLFGSIFAKERLTKDKIISAILGTIGLGLIFTPSISHLGWLALLGAFISGLSSGANVVFAKQITYSSAQSTLMLWVTSVIANIVMALAMREHFPNIGLHVEWLYLLFFAIASVIASWALVQGVKIIDAGAASVLGLLEIVFGLLFGMILFHERPSSLVLAGVVVIILAAAIPYFRNYNMELGTLD